MNSPAPVFRFDHEAYCVVFCRENSAVVQMTSNLADETVAQMYANGIRERGGHVFRAVPAGVLVAALELIRGTPEAPGITVAEIDEIAMSEFKYWRNAPDSNTGSAATDAIADAMSMGAMGAASNLIAAIHGQRAPWHPQPQKGI